MLPDALYRILDVVVVGTVIIVAGAANGGREFRRAARSFGEHLFLLGCVSIAFTGGGGIVGIESRSALLDCSGCAFFKGRVRLPDIRLVRFELLLRLIVRSRLSFGCFGVSRRRTRARVP